MRLARPFVSLLWAAVLSTTVVVGGLLAWTGQAGATAAEAVHSAAVADVAAASIGHGWRRRLENEPAGLRLELQDLVDNGAAVHRVAVARVAAGSDLEVLAAAGDEPAASPSAADQTAAARRALQQRLATTLTLPAAAAGGPRWRCFAPIGEADRSVVAVVDVAVAPGGSPVGLVLWALLIGVLPAGLFGELLARGLDRGLGPLAAALHPRPADGSPAPDLRGLAEGLRRLLHDRERLDARFDDRVRARTRELESLCQAKDEILANTVHEIRTPLTTVLASLGILDEGIATTDEERAMFLEQALTACRHVAFLCNDLLDSAAFEAGRLRMDLAPCDIHEILADSHSIMRPIALAREVVLEFDEPTEPLTIVGDPTRVRQVIFNLVGNALKFSSRGGSVQVRAERTGATAAVVVEDHGIGVPVASRSRLFTKFGRLHSSSESSVSGTGIGLYMCRVLVEQMGGSIGYDERDGGGSVFWFTLPLHAPQPSALAGS